MVSKKIELLAGSSLVLNVSRAAHSGLRWAMVMLQGGYMPMLYSFDASSFNFMVLDSWEIDLK